MRHTPNAGSQKSYSEYEFKMITEVFSSRYDDDGPSMHSIIEAVNKIIDRDGLTLAEGRRLAKHFESGLNKLRLRLYSPTKESPQKESSNERQRLAAERKVARQAIKAAQQPGALIGRGGRVEIKNTATDQDYQQAIRQMAPSRTPDQIARALGISLQAVRETLRNKDV